MKKVDQLLSDYAFYHQTKGNVACHFVGIPLIVFGSLAVLTSSRLFEVGPWWVTGAEVLTALSVVYYLTLDVRFAVGMLAFVAACDGVSRLLWTIGLDPWKVGVAAFVVGWIFQGIGHARYERKAPAFLKNVVHLMVGPIFLINEAFKIRPPTPPPEPPFRRPRLPVSRDGAGTRGGAAA